MLYVQNINAYALSIHKAQGLEYDSVKVVITNDVEDMITSNIFYTAVTRSKDKLKIYWTPETQDKIIFNGRRYKVMKIKDYSLNGFIEYNVILDFEDNDAN